MLLTGCSSEVQAGLRRPLGGCTRRCCCRTNAASTGLGSAPAATREVQVRRRSPDGDSGWGAGQPPGRRGREPQALVPRRVGGGVGREGGRQRSGSPPGSSRERSCVPAEAAGVCPRITCAARGQASPAPAGAPPARGPEAGDWLARPGLLAEHAGGRQTGSAPGWERGRWGPRGRGTSRPRAGAGAVR